MTTKTTLGELITHYPIASRIFYGYGLDYCCGGKESLEEACKAKNLSPDRIFAEITQPAAEDTPIIHWEQRPPDDLINYILARYHEPLREELPRLEDMAAKVERVHGGRSDCPHGLHHHLQILRVEIDQHVAKEEQILFPMIKAGQVGMASGPIHVMMMEHDEHGENLRKTRVLTSDFVTPEDACTTWRELYRGLQLLEKDLMDHIHLENDILFRRIIRSN